MATLDIEPVELPPGRIEELPLPSSGETANPAAEQVPAPNSAIPVNGADLLQSAPTPVNQPQTPASDVLPPIGEDEYRSMADYRKLDWSKGNSELAKIAGVSRQRIAQVRKKIEEERSKAAQPIPDNVPQADFSDVNLPPGMAQPASATAPPGTNETRPDYLAMAKVTFGMTEGLCCTVFGPEWKRENDEEMMSVCIPLSVCLEKWGMSDLPPGYVLCFVCLAYAGKRMNKPTTKDKIARAWLWLKSKFHRRKKVTPVEQPKETT